MLLKQEAINAISNLPDNIEIDDIMYRLYVIEKIHQGQKAVKEKKIISVDDLKKEVQNW